MYHFPTTNHHYSLNLVLYQIWILVHRHLHLLHLFDLYHLQYLPNHQHLYLLFDLQYQVLLLLHHFHQHQ